MNEPTIVQHHGSSEPRPKPQLFIDLTKHEKGSDADRVLTSTERFRAIEARRVKAQRLREPELRALAATVASSYELMEEVAENVRRDKVRREIKRGRTEAQATGARTEARNVLRQKMLADPILAADRSYLEGQTHRDLTAYLSGIAKSDRGQALVNLAIDRLVQRESDEIKEQIKSGRRYFAEIVIGSGPQAQVYNSERLHEDAAHPALTIEASHRIGGQFQPDMDIHGLNTKTGPESANPEDNVAGGSGNKNSLGLGDVQEPDLDNVTYDFQDNIATATRINQVLAGHTMTCAEVVSVRRNPHSGGGLGSTIVEMIDTETGEIYELQTDRVIVAAGLGKDKFELEGTKEAQIESQKVIAREAEKAQLGQDARVQSLGQFQRHIIKSVQKGERPFDSYHSVAVIGAGDSGATTVGKLLGYEGSTGLTTRQDTQIEVSWVGQKAQNGQKYVSTIRPRYSQLGADFPRFDDPNYPHRINPYAGHALGLQYTPDGKIKVNIGLPKKGVEGVFINSNGEEVDYEHTEYIIVDHVVFTAGFEQDFLDTVCARANAEIISEESEKYLRLQEALRTQNAYIHASEECEYDSLQVLEKTTFQGHHSVTWLVKRKPEFVTESKPESFLMTIPITETLDSFDRLLDTGEFVFDSIEMPSQKLRTEKVLDEHDQTGNPEELASRYIDTDIYRIGPIAFAEDREAEMPNYVKDSLAVQSRDRMGNPIRSRVPLWMSVPATRKLAKQLASHDPSHIHPDYLSEKRKIFIDRNTDSEGSVVVLPPPIETSSQNDAVDISLDYSDISDGFPINSVREDLLKLAVSEAMHDYYFPSTLREIVIRFDADQDGLVTISTPNGLLLDEQYRHLIENICSDPVVQTIMYQFLQNARRPNGEIVLLLQKTIPNQVLQTEVGVDSEARRVHLANVRVQEITQ